MPDIIFTITDENYIDIIAPLWEKLKAHHRERSVHFKEQLTLLTWEQRRHLLMEKTADGGAMRINLAYDDHRPVAYCVTTVTRDRKAEIDSIFVEDEYRNRGFGTRFMEDSLAWMLEKGVVSREIGVAAGNEEALAFYARFGFYPRIIVLQYIEKS